MSSAKEGQPTKDLIHYRDVLRNQEVFDLLRIAGYQQVDSGDSPDGIIVFTGGHAVRRNGLQFYRHYALTPFDEERFVIGWPQLPKHPFGELDLVRLAVNNCLGRLDALRNRANPLRNLARVHKKFKDSLEYQNSVDSSGK